MTGPILGPLGLGPRALWLIVFAQLAAYIPGSICIHFEPGSQAHLAHWARAQITPRATCGGSLSTNPYDNPGVKYRFEHAKLVI